MLMFPSSPCRTCPSDAVPRSIAVFVSRSHCLFTGCFFTPINVFASTSPLLLPPPRPHCRHLDDQVRFHMRSRTQGVFLGVELKIALGLEDYRRCGISLERVPELMQIISDEIYQEVSLLAIFAMICGQDGRSRCFVSVRCVVPLPLHDCCPFFPKAHPRRFSSALGRIEDRQQRAHSAPAPPPGCLGLLRLASPAGEASTADPAV